MPLTKQIVPIRFIAGVDTKSDPRTLVPGQLLVLENGTFQSPGRITKRDGFARALGTEILRSAGGDQFPNSISGTMSAISGIATYQDRLLAFDDSYLYSYDGASDSWGGQGQFHCVRATVDPVYRGSTDISATDGCIGSNGIRAYWFTDPAYSLFSVPQSIIYFVGPSGTIIYEAYTDVSGVVGRVVPIGQNILHVWQSGSVLKAQAFPVSDPSNSSSIVQLTPNSGSTNALDTAHPYFDVCTAVTPAGPWAYVTWRTSGTNIGVSALPASNPIFVAASTVITGVVPDKVTVYENVNMQGPSIAWWSGTSMTTQSFGYNLVGTTTTRKWDWSGSNVSPYNIAGVSRLSQDPLLFASLSSSTGNPDRWSVIWNNAVDITTQPNYMLGVALAGKPFTEQSGRAFVPVTHASPTGSGLGLQDTLFLGGNWSATGTASPQRVQAKLLYGLGPGQPVIPNFLPGVWADPQSVGKYEMATTAKLAAQVSGGVIFAPRGVSRAQFQFGSGSYPIVTAQLGRSLFFEGGVMRSFDGTAIAEHGYHLFPEGMTLATGTGGSLSGGQYQYCSVYERFDGQGQVIRSSPSPIVTVSCSANASVTATIPMPRLTDLYSGTISLALYRTIANAPAVNGLTNFYRTTAPVNDRVFGNPLLSSGTVIDTLADGAILGNLPLYTNGGVLENIAPPSTLSPVVHQNRVFLIDAEDPNIIWFSKEVVPSGRTVIGAAVEFSDLLQINMDTRFGDCTALADLDDKLIVFKETSIFYITGQGPDSTGNGSFDQPALVSADCGCIDPKSVVLTPNGLMFKGRKGIYLLTRGLVVTYIGAAVEGYNDRHVRSAVLSQGRQQVVFLLDDGTVLCYDYLVGHWATYTGLGPVDLVNYSGQLTVARASGKVTIQTPNQHDDAGQPVKLRLQTGWIELAGIAGFQRVWRIYILGGYDSPHRLRVRVAYDHVDADAQDVTIDPASTVGADVFGADSSFGSGRAYGASSGTPRPYLFVVRPIVQRCTAIRLTIEDVQLRSEVADGTGGAGFDISAIVLEVGADGKGYRKTVGGATIGS